MVELKNIKTEISFVIWISDSDLIPKNQETALEKREMEVTRKKTTLAITEKMELAVLRVLKKSVEWIVGQLPEGNYIRHLLERALRGEDLSRQRRLKEAVPEKVRSYCVER